MEVPNLDGVDQRRFINDHLKCMHGLISMSIIFKFNKALSLSHTYLTTVTPKTNYLLDKNK